MKTLVVGYGNDLRGDDGAGRIVADRIAALEIPGVEVRSQSQLTPELTLEMVAADRVIFVDASLDVAATTSERISAGAEEDSGWTHHVTPQGLLTMTGAVGPVPAHAYVVSIPVADLEVGMELSPIAADGVEQAVALISDLICE
ncbi:MAG: hydrogenase maturation protease [Acidimicrobiia bacterium]|nr:hydrogenase maturation protease [Acidimicrobiia bacterium]